MHSVATKIFHQLYVSFPFKTWDYIASICCLPLLLFNANLHFSPLNLVPDSNHINPNKSSGCPVEQSDGSMPALAPPPKLGPDLQYGCLQLRALSFSQRGGNAGDTGENSISQQGDSYPRKTVGTRTFPTTSWVLLLRSLFCCDLFQKPV